MIERAKTVIKAGGIATDNHFLDFLIANGYEDLSENSEKVLRMQCDLKGYKGLVLVFESGTAMEMGEVEISPDVEAEISAAQEQINLLNEHIQKLKSKRQ